MNLLMINLIVLLVLFGVSLWSFFHEHMYPSIRTKILIGLFIASTISFIGLYNHNSNELSKRTDALSKQVEQLEEDTEKIAWRYNSYIGDATIITLKGSIINVSQKDTCYTENIKITNDDSISFTHNETPFVINNIDTGIELINQSTGEIIVYKKHIK